MTAPGNREALAAECGIVAAAADHVADFTNEFGELVLFHQRPGERTGTLYHSDMDWEPIVVDDDAITFVKEPIPIITVGGWILDAEEASWLARCLIATSGMRSRRR